MKLLKPGEKRDIYISEKKHRGKKEEEEEEETRKHTQYKTIERAGYREETMQQSGILCSTEYPPSNKGGKNLSYKQMLRELSAAVTRPRKL